MNNLGNTGSGKSVAKPLCEKFSPKSMDVAESKDWLAEGYVTEVKNQVSHFYVIKFTMGINCSVTLLKGQVGLLL